MLTHLLCMDVSDEAETEWRFTMADGGSGALVRRSMPVPHPRLSRRVAPSHHVAYRAPDLGPP
jgi:hypothetical protein